MRSPILSFCIPVMNRLNDIKATLEQNLADNKIDENAVEFIVASFDSDDATTAWITSNFKNELESGYLRYYHLKTLSSWHFGRAKNSFRNLMSGKIYASLDGDNYTGFRGGRHIIDVFEENDFNCIFHQFQGDWGDGTCGRVSMNAEDYINIGYDSNFLPRQWDELDAMLSILNRQRDRAYICYKGKSIFAKSRPFNRYFADHGFTPTIRELDVNKDPLSSEITREVAAEGKHDSNYVQDDPKLKHSSIFNHLSSYIKNTDSAELKIGYINEIVEEQRAMAKDIDGATLLSLFLMPQNQAPLDIKPEDIILACCIKNEKKLEDWHEHYRSLGVTKFLLIDDHSEFPVASVLAFDHVHVWTPKCGQFRYSKAFWLEILLLTYGVGKWCLTVDSDEYLSLPQLLTLQNDTTEYVSPLRKLLSSDSEKKKDYYCGILLDMAPRASAFKEMQTGFGHKLHRLEFDRFQYRPRSSAPAYHGHRTVKWSYGNLSEWAYAIDIRFRVNGSIDSMRKFPLLKFNKGMHLNQGFHDLIINGEKRSPKELGRTDLFPVLHFKLYASQFDSDDESTRPTEHYHQDTAKNLAKLRKNISTSLRQAAITPFSYTFLDFWTLPLPNRSSIEIHTKDIKESTASNATSLVNRDHPIPLVLRDSKPEYKGGVIYAKSLAAAISWIAQKTPYKRIGSVSGLSATLMSD